MKTTSRVGCASLSAALASAGLALLANPACTTTEVNGDGGGPGGSSSGAVSSSSSSSASGGGGSSSSSSGGGSDAPAASPGTVAGLTCYPPAAPASGPTFLPPANSRIIPVPPEAGVDGGPFNVGWGAFNPFGAGTFFFPNDNGLPAGAGTDQPADDAGNRCTTLGSQNSFVAVFDLPSNSWQLSGTIATYAGVGMYLNPCLDAHAFSGIQFTVSGDVGNEATAGDGGAPGQMQFSVSQASDVLVSDAGGAGACTANCTPPSMLFPVTATPATVTVTWSQLTGGSPFASIDAPGQITQFQWQYVWPCAANPTPFTTNVTIANIQLVP